MALNRLTQRRIPDFLTKDKDTADFMQALIDQQAAGGGSGGVTAFTGLTDTFASYTGLGGYTVKVKADLSGLEAVSASASQFTSADTAITPGNPSVFVHSLGAIPSHIRYMLVCQSADVGFTAGDVVEVAPHSGVHTWSGSSANYQYQGFTPVLTASQITCYFADPALPSAAAGNGVLVLTGPIGTGFIDATKWKMRIVASL